VSKKLIAQEVTLKNAQTTLKRLGRFLEKDDLSVEEVLKVEREMERLRTKIERVERERELLQNKVSLATIKLHLSEEPPRRKVLPNAHFYISGRPTILHRNDQLNTGWGLSLFNPKAPASIHLDFDYIPSTQTQIITLGSGTYSEFLGGGKNTFLNPHLDFKFGYASDGDGYFVFGGGANLELFKFKYAFLNLKAEGLGLVGDDGIQWAMLGGIDFAIIY
jgi:hypothetical protein